MGFSSFESEYEIHGVSNTYNWENLLSQGLQFLTFYDENEDMYIILQIHNGCDIRGGYTKPRFFKVLEEDYFFLAMSDVHAYCDCKSLYSDDSGYHWYDDKTGKLTEPTEIWKVVPKKPNAESWEYKLKCEKCGRIMEINYVFTPHKEIVELWKDGYWLEWYVKNLLSSSLETDIYSGIRMKKIKNKREIEVDCILYFSNKVISIQCRAKDFSRPYKEDPEILDLMEFSDVVIFVTTTEISESLESKWKRIKPKIKKIFVRGREIEDLPNIIKRCVK